MKSIKLTHCLILGSIAALTGCETLETMDTRDAPVAMGAQATESVCRANCRLEINLPANSGRPPEASRETMVVAAGQQLNFIVRGGPSGEETTELRFNRPHTPLLDDDGQPLFTATLERGSNRFRTRAWEDGVCHPPDGCKYDIVNTGNPDRPIKDPWIILGR